MEISENLVHRGIATAIVEATSQVMAPLDPEMAEPVHEHLRHAGVGLHLATSVVAIDADGVTLSSGERLRGGRRHHGDRRAT